jgi:ERCC4-type nuclease
MDRTNIIIDVHEMASKTIVNCNCGDVTRDFEDTDAVGRQSGACIQCGQPKMIRDIIPSGKIPLFPHVLVMHLKQEAIPYTRLSLAGTGGDYIIQVAKIIIERKTVGDLIHTWLKGDHKGKPRLETQLQLCLDSYPDASVVLLIEDYYNCIMDFANKGIWIPTYDNVKQSSRGNPFRQSGYYKLNVSPNSLIGKLRAIDARIDRAEDNDRDIFNRLEVVRCAGAEHALKWFMKQVSGVSPTRRGRSVRVHRVKRPFTDTRDKRLFFLEGIPEVGPVTSTKLLEVYGTPKNALDHINDWKGNANLGRITDNMVREGKLVYGIDVDGDE